MNRNYNVMREVLAKAAKPRRPLDFDDFARINQRDKVVGELKRLKDDGLIDGVVEFDSGGLCLACAVNGLTDEGAEFWKLIENDAVWAIIGKALKDADIDIPYPLIKEVCEEVVKRYVTSLIPSIPPNA